jgi:uncharacterized membrane protein YhaH (DUF805 family)
MSTPQELAGQMAQKTDQQLLDMFAKPEDWLPEALDAAKVELRQRNVDMTAVISVGSQQGQRKAESNSWDVAKVKTKRKIYLLFFLLMAVGNIVGAMFGSEVTFFVNLLMGIVFLTLFAKVSMKVLGYSIQTLVGMSIVILFIPFFSLLTIAFVDRRIYDAIKQEGRPTPLAKERELSRCAVWSLVFFWIPVIGLLLGINAIKDIRSRPTELYGTTLAWIAVVLGALDTLGIAVVTFCGIFIWK